MGKEPVVTTGSFNGAPAFFINGKVQPFTSFKITETPDTDAMLKSARIEIPGMAKQGITNCWVPVFIDWAGPGQYDFRDLDRRIETVLKLYDENTAAGTLKAFVAVRIQAAVFSPPWYIDKFRDSEDNPTNLIEFRNPWGKVETAAVTGNSRFATEHRNHHSTFGISPGDEFWDTYALDCLEAIVAHVRRQPYSDRVFAWLPCALNTNEWFIRTAAAEASCDFSGPAQKAFSRYLREKGVKCGEEPVPSPESCYGGERVLLDCNVDEERRVEEFSVWLNRRISEIIVKFAGLVRKHYADSPRLVGFFYGYTNELSGSYNLAQSGHLDLRHLLESEDIDFFCSPCQYKYRGDERDYTYNQVLGAFANSAGICGKLAFAEDDHRPVFAKAATTMMATRDEWHDEMFFRRNFAQVLTHGQHMWWYSLSPEWFREEKRQTIVGDLHRAGVKAIQVDRSPVSEVAVVVDEPSICAMRLNPALQETLILESFSSCFPTGVPFEYYELHSFLKHADHSRFKVVIFLNLFLVNREIEAGIERLKSGNRTLIFQFLPGFARDGGGGRSFSADSASRLTGIELRVESNAEPLIVWIDPERTALVPGGEDIRYGLTSLMDIRPILGVVDRNAEPLGYLYSGTSGLARKKHTGWTSVFTSAPNIPPKVLGALFESAGVHRYMQSGDVVYANSSLIAVSASSRGTKQLRMPGDENLTDVLTGEEFLVGRNGCIEIFMKRHEVRLFRRDSGGNNGKRTGEAERQRARREKPG